MEKIDGEYVRVTAIADVHSPRYLSEFKEALSKCEKPDLFLLAGDMINLGRAEEYWNIADAITNQFGDDLQIVACLGNDEKGIDPVDMKNVIGNRIVFLDNETTVIPHGNRMLGILGIPIVNAYREWKDSSLEEIFEKKIRLIAQHLGELKQSCDKTLLLMHYSPLSTEMFPESFSWWISKTFQEAQPDLIVHGHVHYAKKPIVQIGDTQVINVAYPATRKVTEFQL